ncbi:hypothetical protein [Scytonema sp. PCC 10023]
MLKSTVMFGECLNLELLGFMLQPNLQAIARSAIALFLRYEGI